MSLQNVFIVIYVIDRIYGFLLRFNLVDLIVLVKVVYNLLEGILWFISLLKYMCKIIF